MSTTKVTTDHNEIREWVEGRGGSPARVNSPETSENTPLLRITFPGIHGDDPLQAVEWQEWFDVFENRELAFLYQDKTADGHDSHFNKLVWRREHVQTKQH
jgi:hypothetical protein